MESASDDLIRETLKGNLAAFAEFLKRDSIEIEDVSRCFAGLIITKADVRTVLDALRRGIVPIPLVQRWASFVRRGYVDESSRPVRPFAIEYDQSAGSEIAEVISRLDELGDLIDGQIGQYELDGMIEAMT